MISYGEAKRRAMDSTPDWNQRTMITRAVITWCDEEYEHDLVIDNDDSYSDDGFEEYINENAEKFAREEAESLNVKFDCIDSISFREDYIDDDARFDDEYAAACEFEWECENDR